MLLFEFGEFEADERKFELRHRGKPVRIQRIVLETLFFLMRHRDIVVTKLDLERGPWQGCSVSRAAISRVVMLARRAIGDPTGTMIITVHGRGYRFAGEVTVRDARAVVSERMPFEDWKRRTDPLNRSSASGSACIGEERPETSWLHFGTT